MKRKGSYLATLIDADYRREKFMKRKAIRQKCKDKDCIECKWNEICEDREVNNEKYILLQKDK